MSLYLLETTIQTPDQIKGVIEEKLANIENNLQENNAALIEVQIAKDFSHIFFIVEANDDKVASTIIENEQINIDLQKEVRLIGDSLGEVKSKKEQVNYVVEWNLPEHLTMEQYLERKQKNSVHYAEVPEVTFSRTYVCEDMTKCLCFYDAPSRASVEKAREAVQAPIDAITELKQNDA